MSSATFPISVFFCKLLEKVFANKLKMSKSWTEEDEQKFADTLREYPAIWDMSDSDYHKQHIKKAAYQEIAEYLGKTG